MIFAAKNEKGTLTCDLVLSCNKIVTRRPFIGRKYRLGETYAVQRGRGKSSEGRIMITGIIHHSKWRNANLINRSADDINQILQHEAELEGFLSWKGLLDYMAKHNININDTIRYKFKLVSIIGKGKNG